MNYFFRFFLVTTLFLTACTNNSGQSTLLSSETICNRLTQITQQADCEQALLQVETLYQNNSLEVVDQDPLDAIISSGDPSKCFELAKEEAREFCLNQFPVINDESEEQLNETRPAEQEIINNGEDQVAPSESL